MNTKDKAIKKNPLIKTLSTTLACLVVSSAFALDDRMDEPQPQDEPPEKNPRPDLVPMGLEVHMEFHTQTYRSFGTKFFVSNFGSADCDDDFVAQLGWKVLATNDPAKYPVGYSQYASLIGTSYFHGLKVLETKMGGDLDSLYIPTAVTAVEIYVIVDRNLDDDYYGTWEDDSGMDYIGDVWESCESNNVYMGKKLYFEDYNPTKPILPPILTNPNLEVRKK